MNYVATQGLVASYKQDFADFKNEFNSTLSFLETSIHQKFNGINTSQFTYATSADVLIVNCINRGQYPKKY